MSKTNVVADHTYSIDVRVYCSDPFPTSEPEVKSVGFLITDVEKLDEFFAAYVRQFEKFVRKSIDELEGE